MEELKQDNMETMVGAGRLSYKRKCSLGRLYLSNYKKSGLLFFLVTSNYGVWWLHLH